MTGSISTASTCLAPSASATATSLPLPAPTISTRSGAPGRRAGTGRRRTARGGAALTIGYAVWWGMLLAEMVTPCRGPRSRRRTSVRPLGRRESCSTATSGPATTPTPRRGRQYHDKRRDLPPAQPTPNQRDEHCEAIAPHAIGGSRRNASAENTDDPRRLPRMSRRYASSGLKLHESSSDPLPDARHHGDEQEDDRDAHPLAKQRQPLRTVQEVANAEHVDRHREERDEPDQQRQDDRRQRQQAPARVRAEEADADPEEAGQQYEVREVGEVDVVRGRPADQRQLDEQHEEAKQQQPQPARGRGARRRALLAGRRRRIAACHDRVRSHVR